MRIVSQILATALISGSVAFSSVLMSSGAKAANLYDISTWTSGTNNSTVPSVKYVGFKFREPLKNPLKSVKFSN
jgi:hypothetical protein